MKFTFRIWQFSFTIDIFDLDPSDRNLKCGITVEW